MGLFTPGMIIRSAKKQTSCVLIFFPSLRDEMGRPIRFELRSRARSSCCCTEGWERWHGFEKHCKQTPKKSIPVERREWMRTSCFRWYLRTDLFSPSLYRITFLLVLHWIMRSGEHRPFYSTCASDTSQSTFTQDLSINSCPSLLKKKTVKLFVCSSLYFFFYSKVGLWQVVAFSLL